MITGNPYRGTTFAMLGFRSASTTGFTGAAQNWIAQVRKKALTWETHR